MIERKITKIIKKLFEEIRDIDMAMEDLKKVTNDRLLYSEPSDESSIKK